MERTTSIEHILHTEFGCLKRLHLDARRCYEAIAVLKHMPIRPSTNSCCWQYQLAGVIDVVAVAEQRVERKLWSSRHFSETVILQQTHYVARQGHFSIVDCEVVGAVFISVRQRLVFGSCLQPYAVSLVQGDGIETAPRTRQGVSVVKGNVWCVRVLAQTHIYIVVKGGYTELLPRFGNHSPTTRYAIVSLLRGWPIVVKRSRRSHTFRPIILS